MSAFASAPTRAAAKGSVIPPLDVVGVAGVARSDHLDRARPGQAETGIIVAKTAPGVGAIELAHQVKNVAVVAQGDETMSETGRNEQRVSGSSRQLDAEATKACRRPGAQVDDLVVDGARLRP